METSKLFSIAQATALPERAAAARTAAPIADSPQSRAEISERGDVDEPLLSRERQLWCAVIIHTLYEASGRVAYAEKGERERIRLAAIAWFDEAGSDFIDVCDLAGLAPEAVRAGAMRLIEQPDLPRKRHARRSKLALRAGECNGAVTAAL